MNPIKKAQIHGLGGAEEPSRSGGVELHSKRNVLQHPSGDEKGSLWLLASSPLKVNFHTVVAKGMVLGG